jgi:hypothetical protein
MLQIDKDYNIITEKIDDSTTSYFQDELEIQIGRVLKLKEQGKISDKVARSLIKKFLTDLITSELKQELNFTKLLRSKTKRMMLLKYTNEQSYA